MGKLVEKPVERTAYSVQEDAIPIDPSNFTGGYGQLTFAELATDDTPLRIGTMDGVTDSERGTFSGTIRGISITDETTASFTADSVLAELNAWFSVPPFRGTLGNYMQMLMTIVGVDAHLNIDSTIVNKIIDAPGYEGNVWDNTRQFMSINNFDMSQVRDNVVVRPVRAYTAYDNWDTTNTLSIATSQTTEKLIVDWYDAEYGANTEVTMQNLNDDSPISVDAGTTTVQEFTIDGSLSSVNQPVVQDYVACGSDWTGTPGAYCVSGNDGKPITAAQWKGQGGELFVRITDDPSVIEVTIIAPSDATYAPYRIAATSGTSNYYNSLHITGTGYKWTKNAIEIHTGAPRSATADETSTEFDSKFVTSLASAYSIAVRIGGKLCGGMPTFSGTSRYLNRPADRGGAVGATIADYNDFAALMRLATIADFNTYFAGDTIAEWNEFWDQRMKDSFANQQFGQVVGARMRKDNGYFRVMSTTTSKDLVQYTLEPDTTIGDWNTFAATKNIKTIADWNKWYNGYRFIDFMNKPLKDK